MSTMLTIVSFFRKELTLHMNRVSKRKVIFNTNVFDFESSARTGIFVECNVSRIVK